MWVETKNKLPIKNQLVITYDGKGFTVARYQKALTWSGYEYKFINLMSKGFWNDNITHWMPFPKPPKKE